MTVGARLLRSTRGAAAVEMALVTPLLLIIMMGSFELGNYFMNEHKLVKAVRDGARFAARQNFSNYDACLGSPGGTVVADTRTLVMTGLLSGGTNKLRNWTATTVNVTMNCSATVDGQPMSGIYRDRKDASGTLTGAPRVTVTATVPYQSVLGSLGFSGIGLNLNASQNAAVMGI